MVEGATRTRTPCWWQRSTSSTASSSGKSASVISTSSIASKWRSSCSSERKSRQAVHDADRRARHVAERLDLAAVAEGVRDGVDVRARPDEHGAATVAGCPQDDPAELLEAPAERRDVDEGEGQRAVEDVVGLEVLALEQGVQEHDQRGLEERGDHARETRTLAALAVQARAREQQQHHEAAEREVVERLIPHVGNRVRVAHGALDDERGVDGQLEARAGRARRGWRRATRAAGEVELQEVPEQGLAGPDVALRQRCGLDLLKLFEKSVRHGAPRRHVVKQLQRANVAAWAHNASLREKSLAFCETEVVRRGRVGARFR